MNCSTHKDKRDKKCKECKELIKRESAKLSKSCSDNRNSGAGDFLSNVIDSMFYWWD